jgi:hypothetical protein
MLLGDQANRNGLAVRVHDCCPEHRLGGEAPLCMMSQGAVPEVGENRFRCV